ncbi:alpha-L-arabinofuranosidase [Mucilaginibacter sp. RS28]|uniref:non-reducing end alpha-L-arabinofuranosidase n=1 Tax=Mucilaginibacter straminoryzae TaxID=2932774 RepID=A0A9X1X0D3_9SPHI|nr:alpha-L-arabinofuranosidase C-terminal domain-containing protein [Mucilaginibacter straminoryzae]MCJ8208311.1 alpha-L-arabinofuranosidase [Mucilaginibacter straminoryzae]
MTFQKLLRKGITTCTIALASAGLASAQKTVKISVLDNKPGAHISPSMWGVFFEDINFAADGGLYAELVKNRSFEFPMPMMGWDEKELNGADASLLVVNRSLANTSNPRYAVVTMKKNEGAFVLTNEGFRGMGLTKDESYNFSIMAHAVEGDVKIKVQAVNEKNEPIGEASLDAVKGGWNTYRTSFKCTATAAKGKLNVIFEGKGVVEIDMLSLFPQHTWKQRPNGLRADLVQKLADLHPGFVRFPGGCIVEGRELANRYQWKKTVGDIAERQLIMNRWNVEFSYRNAPDYYQSFGLGFFEYFQLCEDIGATALPILNCGMACQYNSAEVASLNQTDEYIQDALDLVEFANGSTSTKWGGLRASLGHPAPFNLKMVGIGNEQWGEQYLERYKLFAAAMKQKHPEIKLVASAGPGPDGDQFDYLTKVMRQEKANLIDEHYYRSPKWFLNNAARYDNYDRKVSKVFAGEYAAHIMDEDQKDTHAESHNTWWAALSEAAFMTGLERNADMVQLASYAPLLAHVDAWQWRPDLIWFNNLQSVATPNYYVQQLFSTNKGTRVIPALADGKVLAGQDSLYCSATVDSVNNRIIIKLINAAEQSKQISFDMTGKKSAFKQATWTKIATMNKLAFNSIDNPDVVKPVSQKMKWSNKQTVTIEPLSANVFVLPYR